MLGELGSELEEGAPGTRAGDIPWRGACLRGTEGANRRVAGMEGETESRVEGAPGLGGGKGDRKGGGLRKVHQTGKNSLPKRGYFHSPDSSTDSYNLLNPSGQQYQLNPTSLCPPLPQFPLQVEL